jgi:hypothetical protein
MDSATKPRLTKEQIAFATTRSLGATPLAISELTEGWFGTVFGLAMPDASEYVVKIAPGPNVRVLRYERDVMKAEVAVLELVRDRTTLPIPRARRLRHHSRGARSRLLHLHQD